LEEGENDLKKMVVKRLEKES